MRRLLALISSVFLFASILTTSSASGATPSIRVGGVCAKIGASAKLGSISLLCTKSGKKYIWTKVATKAPHPQVQISTNAPATTTGTTGSTNSSSTLSATPQITYYVAQDQSTVQLLNANESCSNPKNASFEIQALVGSDWLPVRLIESGWNISTALCSNPDLGARTSLGWAKAYIDTGTKYRWVFSGEINMQFRDAQGRGVSQVNTFYGIKPFVAKIPIALPVQQNGTLTFSNIVDNFAKIPEVAFKQAQDVLAKNTTPNIMVEIYTGPNTKLDFPNGESQIRESLLNTAKLFGGFAQSPYVGIVSYNAQDEQWAEDKQNEIASKRGYSDIKALLHATKGNCQQSSAPGQFTGPVTSCGGSNAGSVLDSDDSLIEFGMLGNSNGAYVTTGALVGHEYTHTVQSGNWIGNSNCYVQTGHCFRSGMANQGFSPCWLFEGLPQAGGRLAVSANYNQYLSTRTDLPYGWGPTTITDYKEASLRDYLFNQSHSTCYQDGALYKLGYSVGALATEALIAIGGPQAPMALYALGSEGLDFESAFNKVYGISWDDASRVLAKVLAAEYSTFGPAPK